MKAVKFDIKKGWTAAQGPGDNLDYSFDYTNWMESGDTIQTSSWSLVTLTGVVINRFQLVGNVASAYIQCSTAGEEYTVENTIITTNGRTLNTRLTIKCEDF